MTSLYTMQIIDKSTGEVVRGFEPGSRVETDLIEEVLTRAKGDGIGYMKSALAVETTLRQAWNETLLALKSQVLPNQQ